MYGNVAVNFSHFSTADMNAFFKAHRGQLRLVELVPLTVNAKPTIAIFERLTEDAPEGEMPAP